MPVKLARKRNPSTEFEIDSVAGAATTMQVMVEDAKKYAATSGWGSGRFVDSCPVDEAQHETYFACHEARVKGRDSCLRGMRGEVSRETRRCQADPRSHESMESATIERVRTTQPVVDAMTAAWTRRERNL